MGFGQGPIDYTLNTDFMGNLQQGVAIGNGLQQRKMLQQNMQFAQQEHQAALAATQQEMMLKQQEALRQQEFQRRFQDLTSNPGRTYDDYEQLSVLLPQDQRKAFLDTWNAKSAEQQQSLLRNSTEAMAAVQSGKPELAEQRLRTYAEAYKNAGQMEQFNLFNSYADSIKENPQAAAANLGMLMSMVPGGKEVLESLGTTTKQAVDRAKAPAEVAKAQADATKAKAEAQISEFDAENAPVKLTMEQLRQNADIANIRSMIGTRARQLKLDEAKLAQDWELKQQQLGLDRAKVLQLPASAQKIVDTSMVDAATAEGQADTMDGLASKFEAAVQQDAAAGALGKASRKWDKIWGTPNARSQLVQQYSMLKTKMMKEGAKGLGPMTDKDQEIFERGVPDEDAPPAVVAEFLRTMAKAGRRQAVAKNVQSIWAYNNGGLGPARFDQVIEGIPVRQGQSLRQVLQSNGEELYQGMFGDHESNLKVEAESRVNADKVASRGGYR